MRMTTTSDLHLGLAPMPDPSVLGLTTMFGSSMTARPTCLRSGIQKKKTHGSDMVARPRRLGKK
jgi:hypothetical protein